MNVTDTVQSLTGLTAKRANLLAAYIEDAPNWSGTPWLRDSNVGWSKNQMRAMRAIEDAGFIVITANYEGAGTEAVHFTEKARPVIVALLGEDGPATLGLTDAPTAPEWHRDPRPRIPYFTGDAPYECVACGLVHEVTKFPTATRGGAKVRLVECRECRDARTAAGRPAPTA